MKKIKNLILAALIATLFFSCSKEGSQGPAGVNGTNGINGNNNVHSKIFTLASGSNWGDVWQYRTTWIETTVVDSNITQNILNKGAVMVYEGDSTYWNALPYANLNDEWRFICGVNQVTLVYVHADGSNISTTLPGTLTFKVVTIAGQ